MQVCLGTMQYGEGLSMQQGREQLTYAWSRGVNFFDTAEMYPVPQREASHGRSEQCVVRSPYAVSRRVPPVLSHLLCSLYPSSKKHKSQEVRREVVPSA